MQVTQILIQDNLENNILEQLPLVVKIQNLINIDYVRDRNSENTFTVTYLNKQNDIVTQGSVTEQQLAPFEPATLQNVQLKRQS